MSIGSSEVGGVSEPTQMTVYYYYYIIVLHYYIHYFLCFSFSSFLAVNMTMIHLMKPRQFDLTDDRQKESTTRRACVFCSHSFTVVLSCVLPICLRQPKKIFKRSWQMSRLKRTVTPGTVKRYLVCSMNDFAA